jgi:hypothetical protein
MIYIKNESYAEVTISRGFYTVDQEISVGVVFDRPLFIRCYAKA